MKIAYHFLTEDIVGLYDVEIFKRIIGILSKREAIDIHSYVYMGDLLIHSHAMETKTIEKNQSTMIFSKERLIKLVNLWLKGKFGKAVYFIENKLNEIIKEGGAVVYFDNIPVNIAEHLHDELGKFKHYAGCVEVDEANYSHWLLYNSSLKQSLLISDGKAYGLWDGITEESKDYSFDFMKIATNLFKEGGFYSTSFKRTIFDSYHTYEQAKRAEAFSEYTKDILEYIPVSVISKLIPKCPDLSNRLYSILKVYSKAETNEDYSQAACSCRRLIEYVADCLFPPRNDEEKGRPLGKPHYKNRLLAFCDEERKSETNIDVICAATYLLAEQTDTLYKLANKGTHGDVFALETRRCIIRTVLLLDDISSLITFPLDFSGEHNSFPDEFNF